MCVCVCVSRCVKRITLFSKGHSQSNLFGSWWMHIQSTIQLKMCVMEFSCSIKSANGKRKERARTRQRQRRMYECVDCCGLGLLIICVIVKCEMCQDCRTLSRNLNFEEHVQIENEMKKPKTKAEDEECEWKSNNDTHTHMERAVKFKWFELAECATDENQIKRNLRNMSSISWRKWEDRYVADWFKYTHAHQFDGRV